MGIGIYGWTTTNGGGFSPVVPPATNLDVLQSAGYLPYASPTTGSKTNKQHHKVSAEKHDGNRCRRPNSTVSCPEHFMLGSPMNAML